MGATIKTSKQGLIICYIPRKRFPKFKNFLISDIRTIIWSILLQKFQVYQQMERKFLFKVFKNLRMHASWGRLHFRKFQTESLLHLPLEISGKSNQNFWCNGKGLLDEGLAGVGVWCYLFIKLVGFMKFINLHIHNEHSTFQRNTFATFLHLFTLIFILKLLKHAPWYIIKLS